LVTENNWQLPNKKKQADTGGLGGLRKGEKKYARPLQKAKSTGKSWIWEGVNIRKNSFIWKEEEKDQDGRVVFSEGQTVLGGIRKSGRRTSTREIEENKDRRGVRGKGKGGEVISYWGSADY